MIAWSPYSFGEPLRTSRNLYTGQLKQPISGTVRGMSKIIRGFAVLQARPIPFKIEDMIYYDRLVNGSIKR